MTDIDLDELVRILPQLIRDNDTIKGAIITALSGVMATHEDIERVIAANHEEIENAKIESDQRFESIDQRFESQHQEFWK